MIRKISYIFLACILTIAGLSACGPDENTPDSPNTEIVNNDNPDMPEVPKIVTPDYISDFEKQVLDLINQARMQPKKFCEEVVKKYNGKYKNLDPTAYNSLIQDLNNYTPQSQPLKFLSSEYEKLKCHSEYCASQNDITHTRSGCEEVRTGQKMPRYGETVAMDSYPDALAFVMQSLIDPKVPGSGHRYNILDKGHPQFGFYNYTTIAITEKAGTKYIVQGFFVANP